MPIETTDVDIFINKYKVRKIIFEKDLTINEFKNYFVSNAAYFIIEINMLNVNLLFNKTILFYNEMLTLMFKS